MKLSALSNKLIIVAGYGGQDGKSTLSKQLFQANMPGAVHVAIEVANDAGGADILVPPTPDTAAILEDLIAGEGSVICDIGVSALKVMQDVMTDYAQIFQFADAVVIPMCPSDSSEGGSSAQHAVTTIEKLRLLNCVRPEQIFVIPNKVPINATAPEVESLFGPYAQAVRSTGARFVSEAAVWKSGTYDTLRSHFIGEKILEIAKDDTDFKSAIYGNQLSVAQKKLLMLRSRVVSSSQQQLSGNLKAAFAAFRKAAQWSQ